MTLDRDLAIRVFKEKLEALNHALSKTKDARAYDAMITEQAGVVKVHFEVKERKSKEMLEPHEEQGSKGSG